MKRDKNRIKIIDSQAIDRNLWDKCISESQQPRINAYSWYLDIVCPKWQGLVLDNYGAVMPLTYPNRWVKWLANPAFSQQSGLFWTQKPDALTEQEIINTLKTRNFHNYQFNSTNRLIDGLKGLRAKPNYILDLSQSYETTSKLFNSSTQHNIRSAQKRQLEIRPIGGSEVIALKIANPAAGIKPSTYKVLPKLVNAIEHHKMGSAIGVYSNGNLIAAAFFTNCHNRLTYWISASNNEGKKKKAMFLLMDYIIRNQANTPNLLDFEGSTVPGIAYFCEGFGAQPEYYYTLNQLNPKTLTGLLAFTYLSCLKSKNILSASFGTNR